MRHTRSSREAGEVPDETTEQLLQRYRHRYPYISLEHARELDQGEKRYRHLAVAARKRAQLEREAKSEQLRRTIFGLD